MKKGEAIKPSFFSTLPTLVKEAEAEKLGLTDEERHLYRLSQHAGWRVLRGFTEDLLGDLDRGTETAMAQGLPFEEIGRNAVVINLAKSIVKRILQKVDDAVEANEKPDGTEQ